APQVIAGATAAPTSPRLPEAGATEPLSPTAWDVALVETSEAAEGRAAVASAASASAEVPNPPPAEGHLLAGVVPLDLAALQPGVDQFFAHLEGQGPGNTILHAAMALAPWLTAGAAVTAAFELARRLERLGNRRDTRWAGYPGLTVLPTPD